MRFTCGHAAFVIVSFIAGACGDNLSAPDGGTSDANADARAVDAYVPDAMVLDETSSSDGWSVTTTITSGSAGKVQGLITFVKNSGNANTRGGGACLLQREGTACTVDSDCPNFPMGSVPDGYIYCASPGGGTNKTCWQRPGSGLDYCHRGQNAPGTYATPEVSGTGTWIALGCMANEAAPGGCGTTDPTLYVRAISRQIDVP